MKEFKGSAALDAGLLASARAVEHYEISRYVTLKAWAERLGMKEAVNLLGQTLEEEKKTDEALTELAKAAVNEEADRRRSDNGRGLRVRLCDVVGLPRDVSSSRFIMWRSSVRTASLKLIELHFGVPASRGRIAGYRIDEISQQVIVLLGLLLGQYS
jgi:Domain of unknown function (DUF892)